MRIHTSSFAIAGSLVLSVFAAACANDAPTKRMHPVTITTSPNSAYRDLSRAGDGFVATQYFDGTEYLVRLDHAGAEVSAAPVGDDSLLDGVHGDASGDVTGLAWGSATEVVFRQKPDGEIAFATPWGSTDVRLASAHPAGEETIVVGDARRSATRRCGGEAVVVSGIFAAWFDASGQCARVRQIGTPSRGRDVDQFTLAHVAVGPKGELAIVGHFLDTLELGDQAFSATDAYWSDVFVAVFEADGSLRWATSAGSDFDDTVRSASFNGDGSILVVGGRTGSTKGFEIGGGTVRGEESFIAGLDAHVGSFLWSRSFSASEDALVSVDGFDASGRVVVRVDAYDCGLGAEDLADDEPGNDKTCVGALDGKTGATVAMRRLAIQATGAVPEANGFFLTAAFDGRPDLGGGRVRSGVSLVSRFEYR